MVKIIDLIKERENRGDTFIAFEYFPPRTEEGAKNLTRRFKRMAAQEPLYGDVTWGAGGTTADLTLDLCIKMKNDSGMEPNMHLTCTNMDIEKVDSALAGAKNAGIQNILALRGDPPLGAEEWKATEGGPSCALELVQYIRKVHGDYFCVSVAGYPEGHPSVIKKVPEGRQLTESELGRVVYQPDGEYVCFDEDYDKEMKYLKQKVDAGADFIVTQMFFESSVFLEFVNTCRKYDINCPIIPGIMVIQNYNGFVRMTNFCKSRVPKALRASLDAVKDNDADVKAIGIREGTKMCRDILDAGIKGLHFYTLNLEEVTYGILNELGMKRPVPSE